MGPRRSGRSRLARTLDPCRLLAVDTAASSYLYEPSIVEIAQALGLERSVLWGSDFPLRPQARDRRGLERAVAEPSARAALLGGNARRLLGL